MSSTPQKNTQSPPLTPKQRKNQAKLLIRYGDRLLRKHRSAVPEQNALKVERALEGVKQALKDQSSGAGLNQDQLEELHELLLKYFGPLFRCVAICNAWGGANVSWMIQMVAKLMQRIDYRMQ